MIIEEKEQTMCGIAGFCDPNALYTEEKEKWNAILNQMNQVQKHRGPDDEGTYLRNGCGLAHVRLSILDLTTGHQPMLRTRQGKSCAIVYNGEIYNMPELKQELIKAGETFETTSDTEVLLAGYLREGPDYVKRLNGVFAFALWDETLNRLMLCRDPIGVKPLFYTKQGETLVFSSELKGLFEFPGIRPEINTESLCEVFALGPAKTPGKGVFRGISELKSGHYLLCDAEGIREKAYWSLKSEPHEDSWEETVEKTAFLVEDAVKHQMLSDIPISTFLSGGVDSSLVTAICAKELKKQGKQLNTFSFDFKDNEIYFQANAFQPSQDRPYVDKMVEFAKTNHYYLECDNAELADYLYEAVDARDLPNMADVESSMLYFCQKVTPYNKVTLTGECADEIFGGYPWFHKKEAFETDAFPWSQSIEPRKELLKDEVIRELPLKEYAHAAYEQTIAEVPVLEGEGAEEKRRREISYLNLRWFMVTLLDRMDRTSMHSGLEARVPFADYRIVEYLWNVPWTMKSPDGIVKGLLRKAGENYLPNEVLYRKKSPYPKTYHPGYEAELARRLTEVMHNPSSPINALIDPKKVEHFLSAPSNYGRPWYGQLMAGPQMLAYLLQVNYWMEKYQLSL